MKICSKCKLEKPDSEFYARKNRGSGLTSMCKECTLKYMKEKRDSIIELINAYKSLIGCEKCGEARACMLDFHHRDPALKELTISEHPRRTFEKLLPEILKCAVLCANHHREFHYLNLVEGITLEDYLKDKEGSQ